MNYYGAKELVESFRTVRRNTLLVAEDIPEDKFGFRAAPECRSVSEMLVHIATSNRFQHQFHAVDHRTTFAGLDFGALLSEFQAEEKRPRSKEEVIDLLRSGGEKFARWMERLSEEFLAERVTMPEGQTPSSKSRFELLLGAKEHEMHHRGQLMLIERMIGIVPHLTRERQNRAAAAQAGRTKA
jgi:uncharacterized damage-inducible protein DinB